MTICCLTSRFLCDFQTNLVGLMLFCLFNGCIVDAKEKPDNFVVGLFRFPTLSEAASCVVYKSSQTTFFAIFCVYAVEEKSSLSSCICLIVNFSGEVSETSSSGSPKFKPTGVSPCSWNSFSDLVASLKNNGVIKGISQLKISLATNGIVWPRSCEQPSGGISTMYFNISPTRSRVKLI